MSALASLSFAFALSISGPCVGAQDRPSAAPAEAVTAAALNLAQVIPRATQVAQRRSALEDGLARLTDLGVLRQGLTEHTTQAKVLAGQLKILKSSGQYGLDQLADLRRAVAAEGQAIDGFAAAAMQRLTEIETLQNQWMAEEAQWKGWEAAAAQSAGARPVKPVMAEALRAVEASIGALSNAIAPVAQFQKAAGDAQNGVQGTLGEIDALMQSVTGNLLRTSGPLASPQFFKELEVAWDEGLVKGLSGLAWPDRPFWEAQGWIGALQLIASLAIAFGLRRRAGALETSERWGFLARRPFAAGFFAGVSALTPLYGGPMGVWRLLLWVVAGSAAARLLSGFITFRWKARLVYLLAALFLASKLLATINAPMPFFRLYVAIVALAGVPLCVWRSNESKKRGDSSLYTWSLRVGAGVLGVVFAAQMGGYSALATHLFEASIETTFLGLFAWMASLLARATVEYAIGSPLAQRNAALRNHAQPLLKRLALLIDAVVIFVVATAILGVWGALGSPLEAMQKVLGFGLPVRGTTVTVALLLTAGAILYGSFLSSWAVQAVLTEEVFPRRGVDRGAQSSANRLVHYAIVFLGVVFALGSLGLNLQNITILASALGVGIGFGLQSIVNNFVSGLILLFERPIKVGDIVDLGGQLGKVNKIGLRSTVIEALDRSEAIVPNSDLVTNRVINWTLSDRMSCVMIPVGIAYGSDIELALRLLKEVAQANPQVLADPVPLVLLIGFGESSLDLELRAWVVDVATAAQTRSDLLQAVERRLAEADIEIPFPQRDLRLKIVDTARA